MGLIKSIAEIELIRESALLVSKTLGMLAKEIKPGIDTLYLDSLAREEAKNILLEISSGTHNHSHVTSFLTSNR